MLLNSLKDQNALGLVEALLAIAVIGSGMIIITAVTMKTIKIARKNEMQDVAIQAAVEAMDLMKMPGDLSAKFGGSNCNVDNLDGYAKLDFSQTVPVLRGTGRYGYESPIDENNHNIEYLNPNLTDFEVYQQIYIVSGGHEKYDIQAIVVWESVGGEYEKQVIEGYRLGGFNLDPDPAQGDCPGH